MAAIDKLYISNYNDFESLRIWAINYYPKLFRYMYRPFISHIEWNLVHKKNEYIPVMNTPLRVDKRLLWTCPLEIIRVYLKDQCGWKTHWYHKIFWRGKCQYF